jgi:NAD(P) transhydrogenase
MTYHDLIVIGSGPAGAKAAEQAARLNKKVALVERAPRLGGSGISTGTVPSKTLRETALYLSGLRQRSPYGLTYGLQPGVTLDDLMYRKPIVMESEWGIIQRNIDRYNIEVVYGEAHLRDAHVVNVRRPDGSVAGLHAKVIVIATGSIAHCPPALARPHPRVFDPASLLTIGPLPRTLAVVGGGVIGAEYASIFTALGVEVTLIEMQDRLLVNVDAELTERLKRHLEEQGMRIILNEPVAGIEDGSDAEVTLRLQSGEGITCDAALIATGRRGNTLGLGLENVGILVNDFAFIPVNENLQTSVPNIYAAGDVTGRQASAPVSMQHGRALVQHAFGGAPGQSPRADLMPLAVYTIPEVAMVGLTEEQCRAQGRAYLVGRAYSDQNPRGQIISDSSGVLKLIFSPHDKTLLGVHMLGEGASELVHIGLHVMAAGGPLETFTQTMYNYPTLSDLYPQAAYNGLEHWERWKQRQSQ